ncbi:MAG: CVNH domain-containing protein [Brevundimonas sp.]|uniref:hypothetical protein n=1 Tax=Brevundimonas sp. TaxID=1871086 RepID=UPI0025667231|nr:hypothetical protein [Brevundimonas sp.]MDK2746991.1 CVNH domain-containing protein [Brevundimonas sp.]
MVRLSVSKLVSIGAVVGAAAALIAVGAVGAVAQNRPDPQPAASGRALPVGSYRETCRNISLNGDRLRARCIAKDGQSVASTLSVRTCRGAQVRNDNGRLTCDAAPAARTR